MVGHIPWHTVDLTLSASRTIWIATTRPDGRPHAMPVWYWWDGRDVHFITQRSTQKARNLASNPWVIVHAGDGDDAITSRAAPRSSRIATTWLGSTPLIGRNTSIRHPAHPRRSSTRSTTATGCGSSM